MRKLLTVQDFIKYQVNNEDEAKYPFRTPPIPKYEKKPAPDVKILKEIKGLLMP